MFWLIVSPGWDLLGKSIFDEWANYFFSDTLETGSGLVEAEEGRLLHKLQEGAEIGSGW